MKSVSVFGSTGSVGTQALEVISSYKDEFYIVGLVARRASDKLLAQAHEFRPKYVISFQEPTKEWLDALPDGTTYLSFADGLQECINESSVILNAISGIDGIVPTYEVLKRKDKVLLASNKESIVCLSQMVKENRYRVIPVDSEHNALFQLMSSVNREEISKIYLTASGGPFRTKSLEELEYVSVEEALNHPTWKMGSKITVDSATLMNKGIELLEAIALFDIELDRIDVLIQPRSVVHGIVELVDGSYLFHASQTDMRIPISYALFYPQRKSLSFPKKSILELSPIHFEKVDNERFPSISLCKWVAQMGGVYVPVLLGADQSAVELFLEGRIKFTQIYKVVENVLSSVNMKDPGSIEDIKHAVQWGYEKAKEIAKKLR